MSARPALLELAHAVLWRDQCYLVQVGLDRDGQARQVRVTATVRGAEVDSGFVAAGAEVTRHLARGSSVADLASAYGTCFGPFGHLVTKAAQVEHQAGPIIRYAHERAEQRLARFTEQERARYQLDALAHEAAP